MTDIRDSNILIDTDIIIDYFRDIGNLGEIIDNSHNNRCFVSVISIAEIYSNIFPREYEMVEKFLSLLEIVNVDKVISRLAGSYRMKFYKSHRHLFRNIYGFELESKRLDNLIEKFEETVNLFKKEIKEFIDKL